MDENDDFFECETCGKHFTTPLYGIDRERTRTIIYGEGRFPEIDFQAAETILNFCSMGCRAEALPQIVQALEISITHPGIGPVEKCSSCGADVDMTQWHDAFTTGIHDMDTGEISDIDYLAVLCPTCAGI